jgi:hypothetical protein
MKKVGKYILVSIGLMMLLALPVLAASQATDNLKIVGQTNNAPYAAANEYKLAEIIGTAIQAFLGILGVLFLVYIIYAGYKWLTAAGDEEKVTKAKDTIERAVIGLLITIGAYAISYWVFGSLLLGSNIVT